MAQPSLPPFDASASLLQGSQPGANIASSYLRNWISLLRGLLTYTQVISVVAIPVTANNSTSDIVVAIPGVADGDIAEIGNVSPQPAGTALIIGSVSLGQVRLRFCNFSGAPIGSSANVTIRVWRQ